MSKINVGLIGCGGMGLGLARQCNELDDAQIIAVCDTHPGRAQAAGQEFAAPTYTDYLKLLENTTVQAVIIATPDHTHAPIAIAAARAKKHIFCEKPMALTAQDCDSMIKEAMHNKVKLMIGQVLRYFPIFAKTKEIIDSYVLGNPFAISIARMQTGLRGGYDNWANLKEFAGGILFELNVHELDFMRYICGDVVSVFARLERYIAEDRDYEDTGLVMLTFKSGAIGCLHASIVSSIGKWEGNIQCAKGSLFFDSIRGLIEYKPLDGDTEVIESKDIQLEDPVKREVRLFIESVLTDSEPAIPGWEGRCAVELAQAAYISQETGNPVKLPL